MSETLDKRQRLDKWLFFARVLKTRSLAARFVSSGKVRVNREKITKPAFSIKFGDILTITLERGIIIYKICDLGNRRGPASEAQALYEDQTPKLKSSEIQKSITPSHFYIKGRPTKRDRRQLDHFRRQDI
ncbi:RNA-binding S4 domain-containing protein [Bartonella tamiae]|uniref:RNA-binding S4 domain-containing protein n=1 Tax=Bartonella tamiae Th239 TaxID=1094558 RepID=J1K2R2_9HYPH|nr:RNA-binding S4 domain-containing protein [Bartonella tamiae]EJF91782.1 hypothetical protein ME5_00161 [Bartonella tamiae Th239]EJF92550.1 hypothetical protein MEG_01720 [Bartonella tamiae Th307]